MSPSYQLWDTAGQERFRLVFTPQGITFRDTCPFHFQVCHKELLPRGGRCNFGLRYHQVREPLWLSQIGLK
jgi:GTPase SAR1 family protein